MLSVYRSYAQKGKPDKYGLNYFETKTTVGEWRNEHEVLINNKNWENRLYQKQKKWESVGAATTVAKINKNITVSAIIHSYQQNPKFGKGYSKLSGKAVDKNSINMIACR
jgi:ribonuclease HII